MQEAFGAVLVGVIVVSGVVALVTLGMRRRTYEQIGRGGLSLRDGSDRPAREVVPTSAVGLRERDDEIRQMIAARNERRARRGEPPLDVEAELARLTQPVIDPALESEIRSLVIARNERRERRGKPPLDVEAEVQRQLRELGG